MRIGTTQLLLPALSATALGILVSCQVIGPNYTRPPLPVPAAYAGAATAPASQPAHLATDWWRLFNDPDLTALEEAAILDNPDLKAAMARVVQARASADISASQFYPQITFDPSLQASYSPKRSGTNNNVTTPTRLPFDLSYEVDIWGQVARSFESANAATRATADQFAVVLQTLEADVAQNYINLRALEAQDDILTENIRLTQEQLDIVTKKAQPQVGLAGKIDVVQAQTQIDSLRTQQIDLFRQRTDTQHALAILVGKPPSELSLARKPGVLLIPQVPAGLPADILRHRPDVIAAEQNLIAANANIGVALANFYPTVRLTGSAGLASVNVQNIFDWQSALVALGPSVSVPIFEGGRLQATLDQARGRYDELLQTYRSTLLGAFRDVEVSLTDVHLRGDALDAQHRAVESAREYQRLARLEYDQGLLSYFTLLDADRTLLTNQLAESQLLNQRLASTVLLIKALGGGWNSDAPLQSPTSPAATSAAPASAPSALATEKAP